MIKSKLLAILGILTCLSGCGDSDSMDIIASRGNRTRGTVGG